MACPSCQVEHGGSSIGSVVEKKFHLWCKVLDSADTASLCSPVESIPSILKKRNAQSTLEIQGWWQLLKVGGVYPWTAGNNSLKSAGFGSVFHRNVSMYVRYRFKCA